MKKGTIILLVIVGVIVIGIMTIVGRYNAMQQLTVEVENGWAEVENQLNRRFDLIPNLVETVRGYAAHEMDVLTQVTEARARVGGAANTDDRMAANNELSGALSRLLVVVERYPDLKANQNFVRLQDELAGTENRLSTARRRYNDAVTKLNRQIVIFPNNMIANMFGIERATFFEAPTEARTVPQVQF
jgi:LemA protein